MSHCSQTMRFNGRAMGGQKMPQNNAENLSVWQEIEFVYWNIKEQNNVPFLFVPDKRDESHSVSFHSILVWFQHAQNCLIL